MPKMNVFVCKSKCEFPYHIINAIKLAGHLKLYTSVFIGSISEYKIIHTSQMVLDAGNAQMN